MIHFEQFKAKIDNILSATIFMRTLGGGNTMEGLIWETSEELDKKIADRLRLIRKRRSISQQQLAKMSNVSGLKQLVRFLCFPSPKLPLPCR